MVSYLLKALQDKSEELTIGIILHEGEKIFALIRELQFCLNEKR